MLDKWDYCCNQNLPYQKRFASTKTLKQDQLANILRSYFRVEPLTFAEWKRTRMVTC